MERYFARVDKGMVVDIVVCDSQKWLEEKIGGKWVETFISSKDKNYATIGGEYIKEKENFAAKKPFDSWTLNDSCRWESPKEMPRDEKEYAWDEKSKDWKEGKEWQL